MEISTPAYSRSPFDAATSPELAAFLGEDFEARTDGGGYDLDRGYAYRRLLDEARAWYDARSPFREERRIARDLFRGKQWEERVQDASGAWTTERLLIEGQGRTPITMNMVMGLVLNIEGQFRQNRSERQAFAVHQEDEEGVRMLNIARRAVRRGMNARAQEADQFTEHILSGASGFKSFIDFDPVRRRQEIAGRGLDQGRVFYNLDCADRSLSDIRLIGETIDLTPQDLVRTFARSAADADRIAGHYRGWVSGYGGAQSDYGFSRYDSLDFFTPADPALVRCIELWHQRYRWARTALDPLFEYVEGGYGEILLAAEQIEAVNAERAMLGLPLIEADEPRYLPVWTCSFLTPDGHLLYEQDTPYLHAEHPYTQILARLIDGETWGIVSAVKDAQRWLNRVLTSIDYTMTSGSKGGVLYDRAFLEGTGLTQSDVDAWYVSTSDSLGVDVPQGKRLQDFIHREVAEQLPAGYFELVPTLTEFINRISGITDAARGIEPTSGTPASLYQQQIIQSATNILGFFQTYFEGLRRKDKKEIQLIQQAFTEVRTFAEDARGSLVAYDPARVQAMDFDVAMGDVADTATYRQLNEAELREDLAAGHIPYSPVYLDFTSRPDAGRIKEALALWQQQQAEQQAAAAAEMAAALPDIEQALPQLR